MSKSVSALSMKLVGMRDLHEQLKELGAVAGVKVLAKDARMAMKPVLERAQQLVPVDTGLTRDHLRIRVQKPKTGNAVVIAGVTVVKAKTVATGRKRKPHLQSPEWRWHFIEFGTETQPARPFLRPAFAANNGNMVAIMKAQLAKDIKRITSKRAKRRKTSRKRAAK